jgi:hypothetical protein
MKIDNDQIIDKMYIEDLMQVENLNDIGFDVGVVWEADETFYGGTIDTPHYYIKSADIYFPISKDSLDAIINKIKRLGEIGRSIAPSEEEQKKDMEEIDTTIPWRYIEISLLEKKEIPIPRNAICVKRIKNHIMWFEPYGGKLNHGNGRENI